MGSKNEQISLESLIKQINDQFEYVAETYIAHLPSVSEVSQLYITVHTNEAESYEQSVNVSSADEVTIDIGEDEPVCLPFNVIITLDGPGHLQSGEGTTVYMDESVIGAEPRELDTGLRVLRQKLAGICPTCEAEIDSFRDHYTEKHECREVERV